MSNDASLHEGDEANMQSRESWPVAEYWAIEGIVAVAVYWVLGLKPKASGNSATINEWHA